MTGYPQQEPAQFMGQPHGGQPPFGGQESGHPPFGSHVGGQVGGQASGQAGSHVGSQANGQVGGHVGGQASGQVGSHVGGQANGQIGGQVGGQVGGSAGGPVSGQAAYSQNQYIPSHFAQSHFTPPGQQPPGQQAPGQQPPGQSDPGHYAPADGYAVPSGTPGYGHAGYPPAGGFAGQQQPGYAAQQPVAPNGQELADVWMRLLARLIDGVIIGGVLTVVMVPVMIVVFVVSLGSLEVDQNGNTTGGGLSFLFVIVIAELVVFLFMLIAQYVYDVEMSRRSGQTIGKRVLKLRIVPLDPSLPLDRGMLAKRWLVSSPGGLVPGLSLLNPLWCLWDQPYRQCLHDKFAKTVVVKVPA